MAVTPAQQHLADGNKATANAAGNKTSGTKTNGNKVLVGDGPSSDSSSQSFGVFDDIWSKYITDSMDKTSWIKLDGVENQKLSANSANESKDFTSTLEPKNKSTLLKDFNEAITYENFRSIGGMPRAPLPSSDRPVYTGGPGRTYLEHHLKHGTFITFSPGRYNWKLFKDEAKLIQGVTDAANSAVDFTQGLYRKIMSGNLAQFVYEPVTYRAAVGMANQMAVKFMGLDGLDVKIGKSSKRLGKMTSTDWAVVGENVKGLFGNGTVGNIEKNGRNKQNFVSFYVDGSIEVSDNISNSVGSSRVKEAVQAMEGNNMLGEIMRKFFNEKGTSSNIVMALVGNPIIPDVWQDTVYDRSYSVTIKLTAGYGTPLSILLDIIVPLNQILMLALPVGTGGFIMSPFILKAFSSGGINSEGCIISDVSITRNMNTLNDFGMPTELEVTLQIRDLNPRIFREKDGFAKAVSHMNAAYTPFIATLAGMNTATLPLNKKQELDLIFSRMAGNERKDNFKDNVQFWWKNLIGNYDQTKDVVGKGRRYLAEVTGIAQSIMK